MSSWTFVKLDRSAPANVAPVVRCASSQTIRSNVPNAPAFCASPTASMDWYVEKTTVIPFGGCAFSAFPCRTSNSADVVAGKPRSHTEISPSSRSALLSEHTASVAISSRACATHTRRLCDNSEIDGTSTSTVRQRISSAMRSDVYVFPVPHAMMSCPRSAPANPARTSRTASSWCGFGSNFRTIARPVPKSKPPAASTAARSCASPMRATGGFWSWIASSACADQLSFVETSSRCANRVGRPSTWNDLPDAERNVSTSSFETAVPGR